MVPIPDLQPTLVKINPLLDLGDGATHQEVFDIGEYRQKYGAEAAAIKLHQLRAEARRQYERRLMPLLPPIRRYVFVERPRILVSRRAIKASPKASPKRAARKANRARCHGRTSDPDGGGGDPSLWLISNDAGGQQ
jgi:hypothetical protein